MDRTPGQMSEDVEDRRGGGGGGFGGGGLGIIGFIFLVIISLVTGRNYIGAYLSGNSGAPTSESSSRPIQQSAEEKRSAQLVSFVLDDVQNTWRKILAARGVQYRHARLVLFRDIT